MSCHATESHHNDYQYNETGQVCVCAWCWPMGRDLIRRHPHLEGKEFTHTICAKHKTEVLTGAWLANSKN